MALYTCSFISPSPPSLFAPVHRSQPLLRHHRVSYSSASVGSSSSESKASSSSSSSPQTTPSFPSSTTTTSSSSTSTPFVESRAPDPVFSYAFTSSNGNPAARFFRSTESNIEK
ncbi:hypothetical protein PIB30_086117, partial [Stylosanthes scabra]|nr:hypothetical protein [Stylosanthes scabra]